jgi:hypothetical protein
MSEKENVNSTKKEPPRPAMEIWEDMFLSIENMSIPASLSLERRLLTAGRKFRKLLRHHKQLCMELISASLTADKKLKQSRRRKKAAAKRMKEAIESEALENS